MTITIIQPSYLCPLLNLRWSVSSSWTTEEYDWLSALAIDTRRLGDRSGARRHPVCSPSVHKMAQSRRNHTQQQREHEQRGSVSQRQRRDLARQPRCLSVPQIALCPRGPEHLARGRGGGGDEDGGRSEFALAPSAGSDGCLRGWSSRSRHLDNRFRHWPSISKATDERIFWADLARIDDV